MQARDRTEKRPTAGPSEYAARPCRPAADTADTGIVNKLAATVVAGYLSSRGVTYPVAIVAPDAVERLFGDGAVTVPLTVRVGPDGRIVEAYPGWSERSRRAVLGESPAGG